MEDYIQQSHAIMEKFRNAKTSIEESNSFQNESQDPLIKGKLDRFIPPGSEKRLLTENGTGNFEQQCSEQFRKSSNMFYLSQEKYRCSLQKRLQRLFQEEKMLLNKRRSFQNQFGHKNSSTMKHAPYSHYLGCFASSCNLDKIDAKIKMLQQKYQQLGSESNKCREAREEKSFQIRQTSQDYSKQKKQAFDIILQGQFKGVIAAGKKGGYQSIEPRKKKNIKYRANILDTKAALLHSKASRVISKNENHLFSNKANQQIEKSSSKAILLEICQKLEQISGNQKKFYARSKNRSNSNSRAVSKQVMELRGQLKQQAYHKSKAEEKIKAISSKLVELAGRKLSFA